MFKDAVRNRALPLHMEVVKMGPDVELTNVNITGEILYVRKMYEDIFLRANSINEGEYHDYLVQLLSMHYLQNHISILSANDKVVKKLR